MLYLAIVIFLYFSVSECFTNELGNVDLVESLLPAVMLQEYCMPERWNLRWVEFIQIDLASWFSQASWENFG